MMKVISSKFNLIELNFYAIYLATPTMLYTLLLKNKLIILERFIKDILGFFQQYSIISWWSALLVFENHSIARKQPVYHKKLTDVIAKHGNRTLIEADCRYRCKWYHHTIVFTTSLCCQMSCLFLWRYAFLLWICFAYNILNLICILFKDNKIRIRQSIFLRLIDMNILHTGMSVNQRK